MWGLQLEIIFAVPFAAKKRGGARLPQERVIFKLFAFAVLYRQTKRAERRVSLLCAVAAAVPAVKLDVVSKQGLFSLLSKHAIFS